MGDHRGWEREMKIWSKDLWNAFKNIAIVFSFGVNFCMVLGLLLVSLPGIDFAFDLKSDVIQPLFANLDSAFVGLGEAEINTEVVIDEPIPIEFELPLDQQLPIGFDLELDQQLPISFELGIEQDTNVVLREAVPLYGLPAQFNLPGGGGLITGVVSLSLPKDLQLPVHLSMSVPVSQTVPVQMLVPVAETIPVKMSVPVQETIPIQMTVPVHLVLGPSGLDPAVQDLRAVFQPLGDAVESIPDKKEIPLLNWLDEGTSEP
jgi:hypothetical protein